MVLLSSLLHFPSVLLAEPQNFGIAVLPRHFERRFLFAYLFFALVWTVIFVLSKHVSHLLSAVYQKLDHRLRFAWDSNIVAFLHAVLVTPICYFLLLTDVTEDKVYGSDERFEIVICIAIGYFIWDLYICVRNYKDSGFQFFLHAFFCLITYTFTLTPIMEYYALAFLCFESSTPFLHLAWFTSKQTKPNQTLLKFAGISTLVVFFVVRIVLGTVMLVHIYGLLLDFTIVVHWFMRFFFLFACGSLTALNYFWFYKMIQKFLGFSSSKPKKA